MLSGVNPAYLVKIWSIDYNTAVCTTNATMQQCARSNIKHLSRNYPTNDQMLRYQRIHQHFFMDTFFATKKAGKLSRDFTYMQVFVTNKGFVYLVPMQSQKDVSLVVKVFAKEIGAPDVIVCDLAKEQVSQEVKVFCRKMGTTLRVIKEHTQWVNLAK